MVPGLSNRMSLCLAPGGVCTKMLRLAFLLILPNLLHPTTAGRWVSLTADNSAYKMANGLGVPITGKNEVIAEVKVCKGAEIQMMEDDTGAGMWSYFKLGGDNNEWSAMASSENCDSNDCHWVDYKYDPVVDCNTFLPFWFSWNAGGVHSVGKGAVVGTDVILTGTLTAFDVNIFQVSNFDAGVTGVWRFLIDEAPFFNSPAPLGDTVVDVSEDASIGETIYTVVGTDDEGDTLTFTLDTHADAFEFAGTALKTLKLLDFETLASYDIIMSMSDGQNTQQARMTVRVTDVVDETPVITLSGTLYIPEEMAVGSVVNNLFDVDDPDKGDTLTYAITEANSALFNIDASSGLLTIASRIDRDQAALTSLTFDLQVTDSNSLQATETVTVNIVDINDNDPVFASTSHTVSVAENTAADTSLLDFTVSDTDDGTNAAYSISIEAGDDVSPKFKVTGNQLQTEANALDYETLAGSSFMYTLTVVAVNDDAIRTGTTTVTIMVTPENEFDPVFDTPAVDATNQFPGDSLSEDVPVNHEIPFTASDADRGVDGDVTFSLVSAVDSDGADASAKFTIDAATGTLKTLELLDSDTATGGVDYFDVTIRIADAGSTPKTAEGTIRLTLSNVNDNLPTFSSSFYSASISEDAAVGDSVEAVAATDNDGDAITYTVEGSWASTFEISGTDVVTKTLLDYASNAFYVITVRADDGTFQTDTLMTASVVQVVAATFLITAKADVEIREEQGEGTVISGVYKTAGNSGSVTYTLEGTNANRLSVDPASGEITYSSERIDRDGGGMTTLADITLKGVDGLGAESTAALSFIVTDINDNAPVATDMAPTIQVQENSANNQQILSLTMSDADDGDNAVITLSIDSGDTDNVFSITNHDLYVNGGSVDYESLPATKTYSLVLLAVDNPTSARAMTSAIRVTVEILGENEFEPSWTSPTPGAGSTFPEVTIKESATLGQTVETFVATDNDGGDDGLITYSVLDIKNPSSISVTGKFVMTTDGRLVVASLLDYDADTGGVDYYIVTVAASDSSSTNVKSTTGNVKVILEDVEVENVIIVSQVEEADESQLWVMRAFVAVLCVGVLVLAGVMLKGIIANASSSPTVSRKVAPTQEMERSISTTPHMSLQSVRMDEEEDQLSWMKNQ
ncbi:protocadherin Fat 4-like isoform X2 [Haliotis rufescens]|nr:protocadherin Fat 4-like isoform X2 [Haliotis rufescens]